MKKSLITVLFMSLIAAGIVLGSFFQRPEAVTGATRRSSAMPMASSLQVFYGVVESVKEGDATSGIRQMVTVVNNAGERLNFAIKVNTKVYDKNQTDPLAATINRNDHIIVKYISTGSGMNSAVMVSLAE